MTCNLREKIPHLSREAKTSGDTRHGQGDQMVKISISGSGQLKGAEANVIEGLIVNAEGLIGVLNKLMD